MIISKVVGSVVSTSKNERLVGKKLLIVQQVDIETLEIDGKPIVAIDTVGSGKGEYVLLVSGSSARQTEITKDTPVDAAIIGIIDQIELEGKIVFNVKGE